MPRRRIWIELILIAVLGAIFTGRSFVPGWRSLNTDFPAYYLAAHLYSQGDSLARVYDWIWFQRQKNHAGIEKRIVGFIPLTLYSAMPIVPLASMTPLNAKRCWLVINLLLLGVAAALLVKMTTLGRVRTAILVLLAIEPLHTQFLYGQLHIVVLLLIVISLWLYLNDRPAASGAALAVASAIKIYPILFAFYFVRKKQWRAVMGLACGCFLLAVLAIGLFGVEVHRVYAEEVLPRVLRGETLDPYNLNWNSFTALYRRLFVFEPELNPNPLVNTPLGYAVLQALTQGLIFIPLLWLITPRRASAEREKLEYGTYVAALLLLSTNPASYHYVVLIVCGVLVTDYLLQQQRHLQAMLCALLYTLACLPAYRPSDAASGAAMLMSSSRLVFTLSLFLLLLVVLTSGTETWRERFRSRAALALIPMFFVLVSIAAFENFRHIKGEMNYAARIAPVTAFLLMADPAVSEGRIAFTKFQSRGYTIGTLIGKQPSSLSADGDLFYPAAIPHSSQVLAEQAGTTSRIVRLELAEDSRSRGTVAIEVENGERPSVSSDGRWLAFIREVHGRGSLWIKSLQGNDNGEFEANDERNLVAPEYDVLEAAFDTAASEIIFAAQPHNGPALFTVGRSSARITQITFGSAARYPAVSPDGLWLAYGRLSNGSWQLRLKARHPDSDERQLTSGECNSLSPAWTPDSKELVYATDCGRGWGLTALARVRAVP